LKKYVENDCCETIMQQIMASRINYS